MKNKNQLALFRSMLRIRRVEEALADRYSEQEMRCPMHLYIGQEAIAVGVCAALSENDVMFGNHRAHGHYLAKGGDLNAMIAELYGRATGCCGGRGGSMHLIDLDAGFLGATPIVGGTVPLAVGAAWAASSSASYWQDMHPHGACGQSQPSMACNCTRLLEPSTFGYDMQRARASQK